MGQAKIRKKNRTYPTAAQIAQMEAEKQHHELYDLSVPFILDAKDLKLPDVPEHARKKVRVFLAPFLKNIPVKNNDCWNIAQKLMLAANSPRVGYVEGVWTRKTHHDEHVRGECDCTDYKVAASPHAWNTVDGYLVDLSTENKFRGWTPEEAEFWPLDDWWHEPFKTYTHAEIKKFLVDIDEFNGFSISPVICVEGYAEDYGLSFTYADWERTKNTDDWDAEIFKPAIDRMNARLTPSFLEAAA